MSQDQDWTARFSLTPLLPWGWRMELRALRLGVPRWALVSEGCPGKQVAPAG